MKIVVLFRIATVRIWYLHNANQASYRCANYPGLAVPIHCDSISKPGLDMVGHDLDITEHLDLVALLCYSVKSLATPWILWARRRQLQASLNT